MRRAMPTEAVAWSSSAAQSDLQKAAEDETFSQAIKALDLVSQLTSMPEAAMEKAMEILANMKAPYAVGQIGVIGAAMKVK